MAPQIGLPQIHTVIRAISFHLRGYPLGLAGPNIGAPLALAAASKADIHNCIIIIVIMIYLFILQYF